MFKNVVKQYSLAIRKINDNKLFFDSNNSFFKELQINTKGRYWLADPFLFKYNDKVYIFFEAYDLIFNKGKIGYVTFENGKCSKLHIVIEEKYHLSFPYIFEYNHNIYIMPESCGDNCIKLYKAINFPNVWKNDCIIINDIFSCDTIMVNNKYLLTSNMYVKPHNGKYQSCWVKNVLYKISNDLTIDKNFVPTFIAEGDYGIRNAGAILNYDNQLYRVGQNCLNNNYGQGLVFFKINNANIYSEAEYMSFDYDYFQDRINYIDEKRIIGVHTYNKIDNYEIIDFSYYDDISKLVLFLNIVIKIIKKIYHKIFCKG